MALAKSLGPLAAIYGIQGMERVIILYFRVAVYEGECQWPLFV